ncbi:MAG: CAP domain-containing protein [Proteobacteria bacterium]|nr:CAP domain-containing protein [Pseudomonadota bacterium]
MTKNVLFICFLLSLFFAVPACIDELFGDQDDEHNDEDLSDACDNDVDVDGGNDSADGWDAEWAGRECQVLKLVNQRRSQGADCGNYGHFESTGALALQSNLREAARLHSRDMGERNYFSHESPGGPNGIDMLERVENAGYTGWAAIGENIAAGRGAAEETMIGWMESPGHCANIMNPEFSQIGVGYAQVSGSEFIHYWTQDFGRR